MPDVMPTIKLTETTVATLNILNFLGNHCSYIVVLVTVESNPDLITVLLGYVAKALGDHVYREVVPAWLKSVLHKLAEGYMV